MNSAVTAVAPKHRTVGQQLGRGPGVIQASWALGLSVLIAGGFSPAGLRS
ncbi:MAG: hypothetical protein JO079_13490 [Frankiaceae bacterium]|nr:hypothetical protein [Frankiaceae bacterium]MBV9369130.1 hypothetical protein [Frankiales bacterium]